MTFNVGDMVYLLRSRLTHPETFVADSSIEIFHCKIIEAVPIEKNDMAYRLSYKDKELHYLYYDYAFEANIEDYKPKLEIGFLYQNELRLTLERLIK